MVAIGPTVPQIQHPVGCWNDLSQPCHLRESMSTTTTRRLLYAGCLSCFCAWTLAADPPAVAALAAAQVKAHATREGCWSLEIGAASTLDEGLWSQIATLPQVTQLSGSGAHFNDAIVQRLVTISTLETVYFNGPGFTDAGLAAFSALPRLRSLGVDHSTILTGSGLSSFVGKASFTSLHFGGCIIGDEGVKAIARLVQLEDVALGHTRITRASFPLLAQMPALARLEITPNWDPQPYTAADFAAFSGMTRLRELELHDMVLPWDNGLDHLATIPSLKTLKIYWSYLSAADSAQLKAHLPAVTVDIRNPAGEDRLKQYNDRLDKLRSAGGH